MKKSTCVSRPFALIAVVLSLLVSPASAIVGGPWEDDPSMTQAKAEQAELARGNLAEAEALYREVIANSTTPPELLARARLMLADCLVRKGSLPVPEKKVADVREVPPLGLVPDIGERESVDKLIETLPNRTLAKVDEEMLRQAAFEGIVAALGKHADYFNPADLARFQTNFSSKLIGIGAMLSWDEETDSRDELVINGLVDGFAAQKAKLQIGDKIVAIDGKPLAAIGTELHEMVDVIRGDEGTEVVLTVIGVDTGERMKVPLVRTKVELGEARMITDAYGTQKGEAQFMVDEAAGIGAVRIRSFGIGLAEALKKRLEEMTDAGMRGLIIDLRGNGGGSFSESVDAASLFVGSALVVTTKARGGKSQQFEGRLKFAPYGALPTVVLVDQYTASAAEILAAALQDHKLAVVLGERSFGKGSVETLMALGNAGALKYSIHEFFRPSGNPVRRPDDDEEASADPDWGVTPDEGFAIPAKEFPRDLDSKQRFEQDPVWQRALEHLKEEIGK